MSSSHANDNYPRCALKSATGFVERIPSMSCHRSAQTSLNRLAVANCVNASAYHWHDVGPRVLYALREELGNPAFWTAVRAFTQAAVHDGSRTSDLRRTFERAARRSLPIFDRAVYRDGPP
jgi:hypothetical protein